MSRLIDRERLKISDETEFLLSELKDAETPFYRERLMDNIARLMVFNAECLNLQKDLSEIRATLEKRRQDGL